MRRALAVAALAALTLAGCKEVLYSGLTEREANEIVAALVGSGIPASKEESGEGLTVHVDESRFAEAMALLTARGLPTASYESFGDVFQREGIVSSPMEERARYIYALSQELSETISEIDGVLSARVHVVLPQTDMLGRDFQPSSASVFLRHAPDVDVSDFTSQIKSLVATSIEGLVYDNVTVVAVPAAVEAVAAPVAPALESVLGIWVHPSSAGRLWMLLGSLVGLSVLALGGALATVLLRRRGARREPAFEEA